MGWFSSVTHGYNFNLGYLFWWPGIHLSVGTKIWRLFCWRMAFSFFLSSTLNTLNCNRVSPYQYMWNHRTKHQWPTLLVFPTLYTLATRHKLQSMLTIPSSKPARKNKDIEWENMHRKKITNIVHRFLQTKPLLGSPDELSFTVCHGGDIAITYPVSSSHGLSKTARCKTSNQQSEPISYVLVSWLKTHHEATTATATITITYSTVSPKIRYITGNEW